MPWFQVWVFRRADRLLSGWWRAGGCLSVPGFGFERRRHPWARVVGIDLDGNEVDVSGDGLLAQALQHECDHLIGKLYPMRVRDFSRFGYTEVLFPGLDIGDD